MDNRLTRKAISRLTAPARGFSVVRDNNSEDLSRPRRNIGLRSGRVLTGDAGGWEVTSECKEEIRNPSSVLGTGGMFASARGGGGIVSADQDLMFRAGHRWAVHPHRTISRD